MTRSHCCLRALVCCAALGAVTNGWAAPAQTQTVDIVVDATAAGTPLEPIWAFHGYDELNYTTTPDGEALLKALTAAQQAVPNHVRTHFLFNTGNGTASLKWGSTNVYSEDADGNAVYSWTITQSIMDTITGAGALPLVEIGFMPEALSTHPTPYMNSGIFTNDGGCFYPPTDYAKWRSLVSTWAKQMNGRYPNVEDSWLWELWNEPDLDYWHGTFAEYAKLYDYTEAALHDVLPNAALGGPAVAGAGSGFLKQFLEHCATGTNAVSGKAGTRLDLITFHAKGGVTVVGGHVEMNLGNQLRLHQTGFEAVAAVPMYKQTPVYVTEADPEGCAACPATSTPADAYRNSPAYGAYMIAMMKRTLELEASMGVKVGGLVSWAFTFPGTPYFAGYRALASNGIKLPILGAFKLLGSLTGSRLPLTSNGAATLASVVANSVRGATADIDGMATLNGKNVQVLVWNYHDDLVTAPAASVQVSVKVPPGFGSSATVTHERMDSAHGDAYTMWTTQGSPAKPTTLQIQELQRAMDPVPLSDPQTLAASEGSISVTFELPRFGVSLLTLSPTGATQDHDAGSSDAATVGGSTGDAAGNTGGETVGSGGATTSGQTSGANGQTGGQGGGAADAGAHPSTSSDCACDVVGGGARSLWGAALCATGLVIVGRRRRQR